MLTWTPVQTAGVSTAISAALLDVITAHSMLLPEGQSLVNLRLQVTQMAQAAVA
jgi:hypothetical protein